MRDYRYPSWSFRWIALASRPIQCKEDQQHSVSVEFVVQMRISRVVGDELVVLASESFQVFTCLSYLLLVSVEPNDPGPILRQLAEIRHLARGRTVKIDNNLVRLRI